MKELIIGSHVTFNGSTQLLGSVKTALNYGANAFMIYTGAPQNTNRIPLNSRLTKEAWELMDSHNIDLKNVIVHAPYIVNLANPNANYDFSINFLKQEIKRTEELGLDKLVLHPGSHVSLGLETGLDNIINALNIIITEHSKVTVCLETMAGKGSECGFSFDQLKTIIDRVNYPNKIMVCLDTCHLNDAGYDLSDFDKVLHDFDQIIGLDKIACVHINDSKNPLSSHKDRHANIGFGTLGFNNLIKIIYHPSLINVPKILETPFIDYNDQSYPPYKQEIEMIKNKTFNPKLMEDIIHYYI